MCERRGGSFDCGPRDETARAFAQNDGRSGLRRVPAVVGVPTFGLEGDEDGGPGLFGGQMDEEGAILPDAVVAAVAVQRIALVHVYFVDAVDLTGVGIGAAEGVDDAVFIGDGHVKQRRNGILESAGAGEVHRVGFFRHALFPFCLKFGKEGHLGLGDYGLAVDCAADEVECQSTRSGGQSVHAEGERCEGGLVGWGEIFFNGVEDFGAVDGLDVDSDGEGAAGPAHSDLIVCAAAGDDLA